MPASIDSLVQNFTRDLTAAIEATTAERIRATLSSFLGVPLKRGPGRPPKNATAHAIAASPAKPKRRKVRVTAKIRAARKLQGQYLGNLKSLTGDARARVKALAKEKGVAAAVALAKTLKK